MARSRFPAITLTLLLAATPAWAAEDISKVNGGIEVSAGTPYGELDTVNGSITIGERAQTGDASTVNGSIKVASGARVGDLDTVNGAIRLEREVAAGGSISTVNGSVFADRGSVVAGDVETVNGAIGLVQTQVGGNVRTVNGDVTVGVGSLVKGGLTVSRATGWFQTTPKRKPRVVIGPRAVVEGPLVFEREVRLYVHSSARTGTITGAEPVAFDGDTAPEE